MDSVPLALVDDAVCSADVGEDLRELHSSRAHSTSSSRNMLLALAVTQSACSTGVLFGYSALASTLMRRGQYSELCGDAAVAANRGGSGDAAGVCAAQKLRFSLIYTFASTCLFSSFLAFGLIVDKYGGPRRANSIGCTLVALGLLLLAMSDSKTLDLFPLGFAIIGLGGPGVHISLFHVALLFPPARKNTIQSFLVGAFVMSGIAFPVERWLIENASVPRPTVLAAHACVLLCLTVVGLRIWPDKKFTPGDAIQFRKDALLSYVVISGVREPVVHTAPVQAHQPVCEHARVQPSPDKHAECQAVHLRANQGTVHTRERAREETCDPPREMSRVASSAGGPDDGEVVEVEHTDSGPTKTIIETRLDVERCPDVEEEEVGVGVETEADAGGVANQGGETRTAGIGPQTRPGHAHLHTLSLREQLGTAEYRRLAVFMMIHALHFNFYLGTFPQQVTSVYQRVASAAGNSSVTLPTAVTVNTPWQGAAGSPVPAPPPPLTGAATAEEEDDLTAVIQTFSLSLAVMMPSAVITLPCVGRLLDSLPLRSGGFFACNVTGVIYGALVLVPLLSVQWVTMAALSVHRMLLFSSLFAYTGSRSVASCVGKTKISLDGVRGF